MLRNEKALLQRILDRLNSGEDSEFKSLKFNVINNPDGSERWLFPSQCRRPRFLSFYNITSKKSRLFHIVVKLLFNLRLGAFVKSKSVVESIALRGPLGEVISGYGLNFSIFTGTSGKNRKILIEYGDERSSIGFVKVAFGENSWELIENEARVLTYLNDFEFSNVAVPTILKDGNGFLKMTNIRPSGNLDSSDLLTNKHISAASEYQRTNFNSIMWSDLYTTIFLKRFAALDKLEVSQSIEENKILEYVELYKSLMGTFQDSDLFHCGLSHGDFTSWNLFLADEKLYVYDWEMARKDTPVLFDFFHFIFQRGVLIERASLAEIKKKIRQIINEVSKVYPEIDLSEFERQYHFYLLDISSYYIEIYARQSELHMQAYWLIDMWMSAIKDILSGGEGFE